MRRYCIDCGKPVTHDQQPPSPCWCSHCESLRRERIDQGLAGLMARFERKAKGAKA